MPSEEELLASIKPDMKLTKNFLRKIYGYNMSNPSFADEAIVALENAGCSKARKYYDDWVAEYEETHEKEMRAVAKWYRKECQKRWKQKLKEGEERRKQEEKSSLQKMNNKDLIALLESLTGAI